MPETKITHVVTVRAVLELNEAELGALDALVGYGTDSFLKTFYQHMGRAYLEPHEKGLRSLFDNIRGVAPRALADAKTMRDIMRQNPRAHLSLPDEAPKPSRPWWWRMWSARA